MSTEHKGFDTLKVLAMCIKPGQEFIALDIEGTAKRTWYSDHGIDFPDQIYVLGPPNVLRQLLAVAPSPDHQSGDGFYVWGFSSRSIADTFITTVRTFHALSYWQVGLSRQHAVIAEYPLIGYFTSPGRHFRPNVMGEASRLEKARVFAHIALENFRRIVGVSVIIFTDDILQTGTLEFPADHEGLPVLDYEKSEPREGGLIYKQAERHTIHTSGRVQLHSVLFGDNAEARTFFTQLLARDIGTIWHFANCN